MATSDAGQRIERVVAALLAGAGIFLWSRAALDWIEYSSFSISLLWR